jgi:hypothetical protein
MSEWLGRPRLEEKDIKEFQPSIPKYFPFIVRYFIEDQKPRVVLTFPYETFEKVKEILVKRHGKVTPSLVRNLVMEALEEYLKRE